MRGILPDMNGITAIIVAFIFVCILFPRLVKHHAQFYTAFGLVLISMFLETLAVMFGSVGFGRFVTVMNGLLTIVSLVLIVLATGGLSLKDLAGEFKNAIEVIRRGESDKEVIVPLTGEMPKPRRQAEEESPRHVETIDTPVSHPTAPAPRVAGDSSTSIPLE